MSITHGGINKRKTFSWRFEEGSQTVIIKNENDLVHSYAIDEVYQVLNTILQHFNKDYFPLANNVEWLRKGIEKSGLGTAILELEDSDVDHAQGSSYLGVVLEECGYFAWNGKHRGIQWRLIDTDFNPPRLIDRLKLGQHK